MLPFDLIQSWLHRRNLREKLSRAQQWPTAQGQIYHWQIVEADRDAHSTAKPWQVEAGFHFTVNGEYFGGYVRSVGLTHHEAEAAAKNNPDIHVRYDPTNPDSAVVLPEDNEENLPFRVFAPSPD